MKIPFIVEAVQCIQPREHGGTGDASHIEWDFTGYCCLYKECTKQERPIHLSGKNGDRVRWASLPSPSSFPSTATPAIGGIAHLHQAGGGGCHHPRAIDQPLLGFLLGSEGCALGYFTVPYAAHQKGDRVCWQQPGQGVEGVKGEGRCEESGYGGFEY